MKFLICLALLALQSAASADVKLMANDRTIDTLSGKFLSFYLDGSYGTIISDRHMELPKYTAYVSAEHGSALPVRFVLGDTSVTSRDLMFMLEKYLDNPKCHLYV